MGPDLFPDQGDESLPEDDEDESLALQNELQKCLQRTEDLI